VKSAYNEMDTGTADEVLTENHQTDIENFTNFN